MHRVLMNFQLNRTWTVHFIEADCRTPVGRGRFYDFTEPGGLDRVREILTSAAASAEVFAEFNHNIRAWARGSVYLDLTPEQYARLKR